MRVKKPRVCRICQKSYEGVYGLCGTCNQRNTRANYTGSLGCPICGGVASKKRGLCRKCFWAMYRKNVKELREKRNTVGEYSTEGIPRGY
jgi:predicted amidophosphoribosyltransferase